MAEKGKIMTGREVMNAAKADDGSVGLYLMWGDEEFLISETIRYLKKKFIAEGAESMDYVKIDFSDRSFEPDLIRNNTELPPWMSSRRIVEVRNSGIFGSKETDAAESVIKSLPQSTTLIFYENKVDKKKKNLMKLFTDNGIAGEFEYMDDGYLSSFIIRRFSKEGLTINEDAVASIISRCDKSLRRITNEIGKLSLYCTAENISNISFAEVESLCPPDIKGSIFDITDAVGKGNAAEALTVLNSIIILKTPCTMIRFMLARHIRQLICVKEIGNKDKAVARLKIHPFVAKKLMAQAGNFSMDRLITLYTMCAAGDRDFKTGRIDERQSIEIFIVRASQTR